ncbi:MAG: DUF3226 domain-containing protein [Blastocatellia bacterium]
MPQPKEITHSKQLLVEGRDAVAFFAALLKHLGLSEVQIQNFGGINELRPFLKALRNESGFWGKVSSLGVIRDAENNPQGAFQSVRDSLLAADLPAPAKTIVSAGAGPQVSVLILPDAATPGMLESLCLAAVEKDQAFQCVDQYFNCLKQQMTVLPNNLTKARLHAFLSSRPKPDLLVGEAASAGYFPWNHPAFSQAKQFLQGL